MNAPFRSGVFNDPKNDDPVFSSQHDAELYCQAKGRAEPQTPYAVWDQEDNEVFLYFNYQSFVPAR